MKPSKILVLSVAFLSLIIIVAFGVSRFSQKQTPTTTPSSPTSSTSPSVTVPQSSVPEKLSLRGSDILDQNGNPIMLRGMNWGAWGTALPQDAADNVKQGANTVRIPLRWWGKYSKASIDSRADSAPGHIDPAHLAQLDQYIAWASSQHLWIDLFIDSDCGQNGMQTDGGTRGYCDPTNQYGSKGHNFWTDPAMRAEFIEVWKFVANRYKDTPYIGMYELLPEPNPTDFSKDQIKQFYEELIAAVHPIDPNTPFLVGPQSYNIKTAPTAYIETTVPIIYTGNLFVFTGKSQEENIAGLKERLEPLLDLRTKYNVPVFVQQTGSKSGEDPNQVYAAAVLSLLNQNNVGWVWWTYRQHNQNDKDYGVLYQDKSNTWQEKTEVLNVISKFLKQ